MLNYSREMSKLVETVNVMYPIPPCQPVTLNNYILPFYLRLDDGLFRFLFNDLVRIRYFVSFCIILLST